ncbi:MAG TPA: tetratricopeptide repeat protein [Blastocatellia bacterium]|nr:tetratricopeptide repeat protein [Blastocatellia bacterium]
MAKRCAPKSLPANWLNILPETMGKTDKQKSWLREVVEFALDEDVNQEIARQQAILKENPCNAKAHFDLAVLYYSQRRVQESIREFESAIESDPQFAPAYRKLGEVYVALDDYERAGRCAVKAAELGDRMLLEMFERYPAFKKFIER